MVKRNSIYGPKGGVALGYRAKLEDLFSAAFRNDPMVLGVEVENLVGSGNYEVSLQIVNDFVTVVDERIKWDPKKGPAFSYPIGQEFSYIHRGNPLSSKLPRATSLPYFCWEVQRRDATQRP